MKLFLFSVLKLKKKQFIIIFYLKSLQDMTIIHFCLLYYRFVYTLLVLNKLNQSY